MPEKTLFPSRPLITGAKLPPSTDPSTSDLVLEAILSPLGLGTNPEDPALVDPKVKNQFIRAQAAGDLVSMAAPPLAAGITKLPKWKQVENLANIIRGVPESLFSQVERYATKYPRITGHVGDVRMLEGATPATAAFGRFPDTPSLTNLGEVAVNESVLPHATEFDKDYLMGHEMGHAAQSVRRSELEGSALNTRPFDEQYDALNALYGYANNPFERDARWTGTNQANRAFWDARNTPEQPLIPGLIKRKDISDWSAGAADTRRPVFSPSGKGYGTAPVERAGLRLRLEGQEAQDNDYLKELRRAYLNKKFGPSPGGEKQLKLPLDTTSPAGPEFTAVGDEPPRISIHAPNNNEDTIYNMVKGKMGGTAKTDEPRPPAPRIPGFQRSPVQRPDGSIDWSGPDLDAVRYNAALREQSIIRGGDFSPAFLQRFPEYKGQFEGVVGWNKNAVSVELKNGESMILGREDVRNVPIPEGDWRSAPQYRTVMEPDKYDHRTGKPKNPPLPAPKADQATPPDGASFDVSNLKSFLGITTSPSEKVTLIQGDVPKLLIERKQKGSGAPFLETREIPQYVVDELLRRSSARDRGKLVRANLSRPAKDPNYKITGKIGGMP